MDAAGTGAACGRLRGAKPLGFRRLQSVLTERGRVPRLHYLQMACEKIAKAYRLRDLASFNPDDLYSHIVFSKFITGFLKSTPVKHRYLSQDSKRRQMERYARSLATEIEKLAPAVDREQTPANAEYPWLLGETVFLPCLHHYSVSRHLGEQGGRDFLKLIEIALEDYQSITLAG